LNHQRELIQPYAKSTGSSRYSLNGIWTYFTKEADMGKKGFTPEQIIRKLGISDMTYSGGGRNVRG